MDCRRIRWLAGALLCAAVGCAPFGLRPAGGPKGGDLSPSQDEAYKNGHLESVSEAPRKPKASTWVTIADLRAQMARDPARPRTEQEVLEGQARMAYHKALELDPKNLQAYAGIARLYAADGDRNKAMATFAKALKLHPKEAGLWAEQGACQARFQDWEGSLDSFRKATDLDPDNRALAKTYGFMLARAGRPEDAYPWLQRALGEADAHYALGRMLDHLQQPEAAAREAQLALRADPNHEAAQWLFGRLQAGSTMQPVRYEEPAPPTPQIDFAPVDGQE